MSWYNHRIGWIHCALNYGRDHIHEFCQRSMPYQSVLDIGAGSGDDLEIARQINPAALVQAVESYPANVRRLTAQGIPVFPIDIEHDRIPIEDGRVDLVIVNQVLEHIKEIYWVFHEISRVLPVGGSLIVGVPNLASLHNRILLALGIQPTSIRTNSAHVRGFTRGAILQFLEDIYPKGYELKGFKGANFYPFPPFIARQMASLFPSLAWGMFLWLQKRRPYRREFLEAPLVQELETNYYVGAYEDRPDTRFPL